MTRTRKRDDDSQYKSSITSDGTSLALDVSSMSATGSRSSLTFASSQSQLSQKVRRKRPRKRRRKTLSDAMQSISLDRDVPQQILNMKHHTEYDENNGDYTYNVSFVGIDAMPSGVAVGVELDAAGGTANDQTVAAIHANANANANANFNGAASDDAWTFHNHLNSQQRMDRRLDRHGNRHMTMNTGENGGNVYYDCDENSQLTTSSSDEDEESTLDGHLGMDDAQPQHQQQQQQQQQQHDPPKRQHEDEDDQDDNSHGNKKKRAMTELEKAQRKVMLELVFGKNHREARKAAARKASCLPKETDTGPRPIRLAPGSAVPPVSVVATVTNAATATATDGMVVEGSEDTADTNVPAVLRSSATAKDSDPLSRFRDPADRKIEELLRLSLKNVRKGSHPLALPRLNHRSDDDDNSSGNGNRNNNNNNDEGFVTTPWKTQDDMAIDPEIYSRPLVVVTAPTTDASPLPAPMKVEDGPEPPAAAAEAAAGASPMAHEAFASLPNPGPEPTRFPRKRSNSLPGGLDSGGAVLGTTDMETDDG